MKLDLSTLRSSLTILCLLLAPIGVADAQRAPDPQRAADAKRAPASADEPAAKVTAPVAPVNLNTATVEQLLTLPGIGPSKAQAIVETRQKIGGFKKLEDLLRVKGIGRKTFRKLEPMLKL
jgi:competence protein ComEA